MTMAKDLPNQDGFSVVVTVPLYDNPRNCRMIRIADNLTAEMGKHIANHIAAVVSAAIEMAVKFPERTCNVLSVATAEWGKHEAAMASQFERENPPGEVKPLRPGVH
jgi:hypothetical protein